MEGLKSSEQEAREIVDAIPQTIAVLSPDGQPRIPAPLAAHIDEDFAVVVRAMERLAGVA